MGINPLGVAITPDGSKVLVSNRGAATLSVIATSTNTVTATVPVGSTPYGVAISASGTTAYVACAGAGSVSVVNLTTNTAGAPITVGAMPVGLSFTPGGGTLVVTNAMSGTVSVVDTGTATVTSTVPVGAQPLYVTAAYIEDQSLAVTTGSLPAPTVGTAYSGTPAVTGGTGPFTWAVSAGSLPAGLSLNASTGEVSGTPTAAGPASFTLQVTDSAGTTASKAYTFTVGQAAPPTPPPSPANLAVTVAPPPVGVVGAPYTAMMTATGGTGPYTWAVTGGTLPAGLTLNAATGKISGTATTAGTTTVTVRVTDTCGRTGERELSFTVRHPAPAGAVTTTGSASLPVTGVDTMTLTALGLLLITAGASLVTPVSRPSSSAERRRP
ncbi:putative Ig domain-containing protein [Dactylosporangium sp. CA-152071]|uniref:putative Ig domain-containing protein n=1 Tax=Dactylosporangium sp. CA-152071 TaxID=3239933 RepID=UPI003D9207A9